MHLKLKICTCSSELLFYYSSLLSLSSNLVILKDYRWSNGTSSSLPAVQFTASQCTGGTANSITDCASFESITYCPEHQYSAVLCSSKTSILYNIYLCIFYVFNYCTFMPNFKISQIHNGWYFCIGLYQLRHYNYNYPMEILGKALTDDSPSLCMYVCTCIWA